MFELKFEWDDYKNKNNLQKHGICFEEASTVFYDPDAIVFDDPDHSIGEERFIILGASLSKKLCIVSHCYRGNDDVVRIISARKATKSETRIYREGI